MNKLLAKIGLGEKMSKNFLAILIVAFGGAIIYGYRISVLTTMMSIWKRTILPIHRWVCSVVYLGFSE